MSRATPYATPHATPHAASRAGRKAPGPAPAKLALCRWIDRHAASLARLADTIHAHPELGYQERRASALLADRLARAGLAVTKPYDGLETAFRAEAGAGRPRVALLAEYDALPGLGHACAHNLSGVASVAAALALAALPPELAPPGSVAVIGTPAEEGTVPGAGGKVRLVEAGAFAEVDAALMIHFADATVLSTPLLARESLVLTFHGRAAHAAGSPEAGRNALEAAVLFFNALNALRQHLTADVRVNGIISHGGETPNVIPDLAEVRVNLRAETLERLQAVSERVRDCARGAALATGTTVESAPWALTYADFRPDQALLALVGENLTALGVEWAERGAKSYSTDMGNVSHVVPAAHPYLALAPADAPCHSPGFAAAAASPEGHQALLTAAKALALTAYDVRAGRLAGVRQESLPQNPSQNRPRGGHAR